MNARSVDDALDRLAPPQPFAHDWNDVVRRAETAAAHPSRPVWRQRRWVVAAVVIAAIVVPVAAATIGATNDWWFFSGGHGDHPLTQPVVIKTGTWDGKRWQLVAFRATPEHAVLPADLIDICTAVMPYASPPSASTGGALGCGGFSAAPPGSPGGPRGIGFASSQSPGLPYWGAGPVVDTATEVELSFRNGDLLRVRTYAAPESLGPVRFFATPIPEEPIKVVGVDDSGGVVACMPLDPASARC